MKFVAVAYLVLCGGNIKLKLDVAFAFRRPDFVLGVIDSERALRCDSATTNH